MTENKFYNETFEFTLTVIVYDYKKTKELKKLGEQIIEMGMDRSKAIDILDNSKAFCADFTSTILIAFDINEFKNIKNSTIEALKTIQHECQHVRGYVLHNISENINTTDTEVYLRISDWAFKKCLTVRYFKKLLK